MQNAKRGETIVHACDRGFLDVTCNMTGTWDVNDIVDRDCRRTRGGGSER